MPQFTLLIESATLLHAKHKCVIQASSLEELIAGINQSLNLEQPTLLIEMYDQEFEDFVGKLMLCVCLLRRIYDITVFQL